MCTPKVDSLRVRADVKATNQQAANILAIPLQ